MGFLQNFTVQALFLVFIFAVAGNAIFGILRAVNADPQMTIANFFALPEAKILKQCIKFTVFVIIIYSVVQLMHYAN